MINKKRFKCRPWPVNIQVNLFSYIFRILFQDCQWKIYFKSILGTYWHQQWLQSTYPSLSHPLRLNAPSCIHVKRVKKTVPVTCFWHCYDEAEDCERGIIMILCSAHNATATFLSLSAIAMERSLREISGMSRDKLKCFVDSPQICPMQRL